MAVHDYVIANGTGSAVRSDLNNALAAIVSNNSSSSEPATTYAYQWWADTNTNTLKLRNSSNNGWVTLRELDGTMLMEDGTASAPGLAFAADLNTGLFRPQADAIAFSAGGAERLGVGSSEVVVNNPSNDVDFRVESNGETHMLFVDAGNDRVGIGTSSPGRKLVVTGDTNTVVAIEGATNGTSSVFLGDSDDEDIGALTYNHVSNHLEMIVNAAKRVEVQSSGKVFIHKPGSANQANLIINSGGAGDPSSQDPRIQFSASGLESENTTEIRSTGAYNARALAFYTGTDTNGSERMRLASNGNWYWGSSGILPSASQPGVLLQNTTYPYFIMSSGADTSSRFKMEFVNGNGTVGTIVTNGSATAYNTSSDYRLKENVVDIADGITRVKQLQPKRFNFIVDADTKVDGFLAHEAQTVVPEAVTGTHNEVDDDNNPVYQGIDQSKLVPLLTAALQEAIAKIETLETKVAALEAG